jgi:tetratricopeptide (TPR) repeat protein
MSQISLPDFDSQWNYSDPAGTETKFRAIALDVSETASEGYLVELETQIARTLGLQRKFDEAHATLDAIESLDSTQSGRPRVRYLLERGRIFNSSGQKSAAMPLFSEAWAVGSQIGEDGLAVDAAHMIAIIETPSEALRWNLIALELAESSGMAAARKWRKSLNNNLGWTFFDLQDLEKALFHFERSREIAAEALDTESERIALWCIAKTLRFLGRVEEALASQEQQLSAITAEGKDGAYVFEELGECLYALGREEEAIPFFAKAHAALSADPWLAESDPGRIKRLGELGRVES